MTLATLKSKQRGFTLIEIIIVLAIAALIILIVLNAVASAQRASRDTARKHDMGVTVGELTSSASNNNGVYPSGVDLSAAVPAGLATSYDPNSIVTGGAPKYTHVGAGACPVPGTSGMYNYIYTPGAASRSFTLNVCVEGGAVAAGVQISQ